MSTRGQQESTAKDLHSIFLRLCSQPQFSLESRNTTVRPRTLRLVLVNQLYAIEASHSACDLCNEHLHNDNGKTTSTRPLVVRHRVATLTSKTHRTGASAASWKWWVRDGQMLGWFGGPL